MAGQRETPPRAGLGVEVRKTVCEAGGNCKAIHPVYIKKVHVAFDIIIGRTEGEIYLIPA